MLLGRLTGRHDVVFGATAAVRPAEVPGIEALVGLCINTLPVRVRVTPGQRLVDLLGEIQAAQAELSEHQHLSLTEVQALAGVGELFDTVLIFENYPVRPEAVGAPQDGLRVVDGAGRDATTTRWSSSRGNPCAYSWGTVRTSSTIRPSRGSRSVWSASWRVLADAPERTVAQLDIIAPRERECLLRRWGNVSPGGGGVDHTVLPPELFEDQVRPYSRRPGPWFEVASSSPTGS